MVIKAINDCGQVKELVSWTERGRLALLVLSVCRLVGRGKTKCANAGGLKLLACLICFLAVLVNRFAYLN